MSDESRRDTSGDHVIIDGSTGELVCERCKSRYKPTLPCDVDVYLGILSTFGDKHRNCKEA